jgi:cholesterol transport system auxiliary component
MALQVAPNAAVVRISVPVAPKALGGEDVVVSPDGRRLAYAQGASWAQPVPRLLQSAIVGAFGQKPSVNAIVAPTVARADYALEVRVQSFEASFDRGEDAAPMALVRLTATLTDLNTRSIAATREFSATRRASERRVGSIVEAQDQATQEVMDALTQWTADITSGKRS